MFNFSKLFPIQKFKVYEESMVPLYRPGDIVLASPLPYFFSQPKVHDIIVFSLGKKYLIKKIEKIVGKKYFVVGLNTGKSIDSRTFGPISHKQIVGRVITKI